MLQDLRASLALAQAKDVLLKGCSAGGMAVYLHADHVGAQLQEWRSSSSSSSSSALRYAAAPGAGMFLDQRAFAINASFSDLLLWGLEAQNASGSLSAACVGAARAGGGDPRRCYLAPHALPFVQTPLFISNALTDSCALSFLMELLCDPRQPGSCSAAQLKYVSAYRASMLGVVAPVLAANARHGAFLQACWTHIVEDDAVAWGSTLVQGQTQVETFAAWWEGGGGSGSGSRTVVVDGEWGSNPTCSNLGGCD